MEFEPVRRSVETPDGVSIALQIWGAVRDGAADILFVHGYSQSHMSWMNQICDENFQKYRLVTYDLRGHGDSEKPLEAEYYKQGDRWADELNAVIGAGCTQPPVVIAWSYAGRVVLDYIRKYGSKGISGLVMVTATSSGKPECFGPGVAKLGSMHAEDLETNVASVIDLWASCTKGKLPDDQIMPLIASNMVVPPIVRRHMSGRDASYDDALDAVRCPTLIIHGTDDPINTLNMAYHSRDTIAGSELLVYEKTGHAPFLERPHRFATDVIGFVDRIVGVR